MTTPGILIARPDGLTHVPNVVAVTAEVVRLLDDVLDRLTEAAADDQTDTDTGQEPEP